MLNAKYHRVIFVLIQYNTSNILRTKLNFINVEINIEAKLNQENYYSSCYSYNVMFQVVLSMCKTYFGLPFYHINRILDELLKSELHD